MGKAITVEYDKGKNRFMVRCPIFANDIMTGAPSKRWNKQARAWALPAIRMNVEFIHNTLSQLADVEPEARDVISSVLDGTATAGDGSDWPHYHQFKTKPRPYQLDGMKKWYGKHAFALYMDMGTGKSKVAIDVVSALVNERKVEALLIVCKLTITENWVEQLLTHMGVEATVRIHENDPRVFMDWLADSKDVPLKIYIVGTESFSQGSAHQFAEKFLLMHNKTMCIVDEAHMISNHKSIRSERIVSLGRKADYRAILTGTPITAGPMNLFMQFEFLDPNIIGLGDYYAFRNRYAIMGGPMIEVRGRKMAVEIIGYQNLEELIGLVEPYIFQVRKKDVLTEIPDKIYVRRKVPMAPEQIRIYKEIGKKEYSWDDKQVKLKNVLEVMLRKQQVCGGFVATKDTTKKWNQKTEEWVDQDFSTMHPIFKDVEDNPKIKELRSVIEEMGDDPGIIWCRFIPEMEAVAELLGRMGKRFVQIDGSVENARRKVMVDSFQSGGVDYVVANQQTAGVGLTMTRAKWVGYYSNTFSFTDRDQSEDRAHRLGQVNAVTYVDFVMGKTVDELVMRAVEEKKDMSEFLREKFGSGESLEL